MPEFLGSDLELILSLQKEAAREAGCAIVAARESRNLDIRFKGLRDLVTSADLAAEAIVLRRIRETFPQHAIVSEEASPHLAAEKYLGPIWLLDPIDGTMNFAHGHFHVAVSIAFADKGKVLAATVHAPFLHETFTAMRGAGAWLNDEPIRASATRELKDALIATGFPAQRDDVDALSHRVGTVVANCRDLRRLGSAALDTCWVAAGRLDGYFETVNSWDIAAAGLVAREAGARVGSFAERKIKLPEELSGESFLVAAPAVYDSLRELLTAAAIE